MIVGKCQKCGWDYYGWKLRFPRNQTCVNCGTALEITVDGEKSITGYSPFTAQKYYIQLPTNVPSLIENSSDKIKESGS